MDTVSVNALNPNEGLGNDCSTTRRINREHCYPCSTGDDRTSATTMQGCWPHLPAAAWKTPTSAPASSLLPTSFLQRRGWLLMAVPVTLVEITRSLLWCSGTWHDRSCVSLCASMSLLEDTRYSMPSERRHHSRARSSHSNKVKPFPFVYGKKCHLWFPHLSIPDLAEVSEHWVASNVSGIVHKKLPFHQFTNICVCVYNYGINL